MAFFVILIALRDSAGFWRRAYQAAAVLSVLAIILAATRGTILALIVAGSAALAYAAWKGRRKSQVRRAIRAYRTDYLCRPFFRISCELAHRAGLNPLRVSLLSPFRMGPSLVASSSGQNITAEALKHPFSGYGTEHIAQLFDKSVYDPSKIIEQWFDRSHNAFLDYLAQYGVFRLALYLALIGAFAACALPTVPPRTTRLLTNPGLLFLPPYPYLRGAKFLRLRYAAFALATVCSFCTPHSQALGRTDYPNVGVCRSFVPSPRLSRAFVLIIVPAVVLPLYANVLLTKGYLFHLTDVNRANAYFERGLALETYADLEYGYQAYNMYTDHQATSAIRKESSRRL